MNQASLYTVILSTVKCDYCTSEAEEASVAQKYLSIPPSVGDIVGNYRVFASAPYVMTQTSARGRKQRVQKAGAHEVHATTHIYTTSDFLKYLKCITRYLVLRKLKI